MSSSPPLLRRLSETSTSSKESLINAYEAEEERIINILSRKLEKLREEKIELENVLEAESESHVNRLSREISALRMAQQQQVVNGNGNGSGSISPMETRQPMAIHAHGHMNGSPMEPTAEMMLDAMKRENEQLRSRLVETERDYTRISRLNEIYREELIEHRRRLGLPVDNLIGLASSAQDPWSQPLHRRPSIPPSPSFAPYGNPSVPSARVPIPRPPSQIHRPSHTTSTADSLSTTPPSSSSASLSSQFLFSPPAASRSNATGITTPASGGSMASAAGGTVPRALELTYPSVPPPSLSSSFGDPLSIVSPALSPRVQSAVAPVPIPRANPRPSRDISVSPIDNYSLHNPRGPSLSPRTSLHLQRRSSFERAPWASGDASVSPVRNRSRMASMERGARIAETGSLLRSGSMSGGANSLNGNAAPDELAAARPPGN
ncbi:hypothetical protein BDW22DRAFT_1485384 [Trametopsis cervina]|nr:hypothetical protein BDW22DRAFT_1485384 [Trametopsis cervina]